MNNYLQDPTKCCYPYAIEKHLKKANKEDLKAIASDPSQAKEMIYLFCSNLVSTQYEFLHGNGHKIKNLHSRILLEQCGNNYKQIIDYLIKHELLKTDNRYVVGEKSKSYWFTEKVLRSKVKEHYLKFDTIINRRQKINNTYSQALAKNVIANISIEKVYPHLELPSINAVQALLEKRVSAKYVTPKGKKYIKPSKKKRQRLLEGSDVIYTDDLMNIYNYLTKGGIKQFSIGNENCPRPISSITLMPSVIRKEIKMGGQELYELDYTALHPNIANCLYGENQSMITHKDMEVYLSIPYLQAKKYNLSYFNYEEKYFLSSKASKYYQENHPILFDELLRIKQINPMIITHSLFKKEVELMTNVFVELDKNGIRPVYVYDAVLVIKEHVSQTREIMNLVAKQMGINSIVK